MAGVRKGAKETRDFTTSPTAAWVVDVPANMTCATITYQALGQAGTTPELRITPSSGGTTLSRAWREFKVGNNSDRVKDILASTEPGPVFSNSVSTDMYGSANIWNLRTAAPMVVISNPASEQKVPDTQDLVFNVVKSAVAVDQFIIENEQGTSIDAGVMSIQFYNRTTTVWSHDFAVTSQTEMEVTGITKQNGSVLIVAAYDLVLPTNSIISRVSADGGSTWDSGASDYITHWLNNASAGVAATTSSELSGPNSTDQGVCCEVWGLPMESRTLFVSGSMSNAGTGRYARFNRRDTRQVEDGLQVGVSAGAFTAGTMYVTGYKM